MARPRLAEIDTATTERILVAAEERFAAAGFEAARLEDVAADAGVTRPSLLYHFESKDGLYAAVVRRVFAGLGEAMVRAMATEGSFQERLDRTVRDYVTFLLEHPSLARIFVRELLDGRGPGRTLLEDEVAPLVAMAEKFLHDGADSSGLARGDERGALLLVIGGAVLYAIAGDLRGVFHPAKPAAVTAEIQRLVRAMVPAGAETKRKGKR